MSSVGVFWDRDDTLVRDPGYISSPEQVELLPGAAAALKLLSEAGFQNVVVTNQSGVARGMFDEAMLERIHDRVVALFAAEGAVIDAIYYCPYLDGPEAVVERYRQDSDLRKPKPGMILRAAAERQIDLAGSWMIGDSLHDAQAGRAAGCRTVLIRKPGETPARKGIDVDFVADSVEDAARIVLKYTRGAKAKPPEANMEEKPAEAEKTPVPDAAAATLQEILTFLRSLERRWRVEEFSLAKLAGTLVQMLALGVAFWGIFGWLRGEQAEVFIRMQLATFLQVLALTCFLLTPRR